MSLLHCLGAIANLEGLFDIKLPKDLDHHSTLATQDQRIRVLERRCSIAAPPPISDTSAPALAWRLWRLMRTIWVRDTLGTQAYVHLLGDSGSSVITMEMVRVAADSIGEGLTSCGGRSSRASSTVKSEEMGTEKVEHGSKDESVSETQELCILLQRLCWLAGKKRLRFDPVQDDLACVYSVAISLSLENENPHRGIVFPPPPPPTLPPPGIPPPFLTPGNFNGHHPPPPGIGRRGKSCCGCCACRCHHNRPISAPSSSSGSSSSSSCSERMPRLRRRQRWFGWLGKLAFWKKSGRRCRGDDSSSSTTYLD